MVFVCDVVGRSTFDWLVFVCDVVGRFTFDWVLFVCDVFGRFVLGCVVFACVVFAFLVFGRSFVEAAELLVRELGGRSVFVAALWLLPVADAGRLALEFAE